MHEDYPSAYVRDETHLVVVNPRRDSAVLGVPEAAGATLIWGSGVRPGDGGLVIDGFGYGVLVVGSPTR